mgnify:FL=1
MLVSTPAGRWCSCPQFIAATKQTAWTHLTTNLLCWAKLDGVLGTVVETTREFQQRTGQIALRVLTRNCRKIVIGLGSSAFVLGNLRRSASSLSIGRAQTNKGNTPRCASTVQ